MKSIGLIELGGESLNQHVYIKDQSGKLNKWIIEDENDITYKVFYDCHITEVYKNKCYIQQNKLYSTEVRAIYEDDMLPDAES
jgi:hypothetical protein